MKNPYSIEQYGVGKKRYGMAGRTAPNLGAVSGQGRMGYKERDRRTQMRRNALLRRMKAKQKGKFMNPDVLRGRMG